MGRGEWKGGRRVNGLRSDGVHEVSLNRSLNKEILKRTIFGPMGCEICGHLPL